MRLICAQVHFWVGFSFRILRYSYHNTLQWENTEKPLTMLKGAFKSSFLVSMAKNIELNPEQGQ